MEENKEMMTTEEQNQEVMETPSKGGNLSTIVKFVVGLAAVTAGAVAIVKHNRKKAKGGDPVETEDEDFDDFTEVDESPEASFEEVKSEN